ncbi:MAG: HNH endonuclease [Syntrophobacteraceae bacterium]
MEYSYVNGVDRDLAIRLATFAWLAVQTAALGDVLPRELLQKGFEFQGERVPLVAPQGIFKPRIMDLPLSIATIPHGPYRDAFASDGLLAYKYRGTDLSHPDNEGLRRAMAMKVPLVYLHGIVAGKYLAVWPVYIVGDDPSSFTFHVAVDDAAYLPQSNERAVADDTVVARRAYVTATVRVRLHQRSFREKVIAAYRSQCSLCRLRHQELLDAAHIIPDPEPEGEPSVSNGIALCKLHHAAFDSFILGVSPDYRVHVRRDVLNEHDGPILRYGLQELHGIKLILPASTAKWPNRDALEWRFERFRGAA